MRKVLAVHLLHLREDSSPSRGESFLTNDVEATLPHLGFTVEEKPTLQWSFEVAYRIAKCKKPHTIAEELIKSCTEKMVETMIESGAKKKIQQVTHNPNKAGS